MSCETCSGLESVAPCAVCRPATASPVSGRQVMRAFARGEAARKRVLDQLDQNSLDPKTVPWPKPTLPEDGSYAPSKMWLRMGKQASDPELVKSMLAIGAQENFGLLVEATPERRASLESVLGDDAKRITFVPASPLGESPWFEDSREIGEDGDVRVPARLRRTEEFEDWKAKGMFLRDEVWGARDARLGTDANLERWQGPPGSLGRFSTGIQVELRQEQAVAAAHALSLGRKVTEGISYAEGGNVLRGTNAAGEPYAVVGKDSVALTRVSLARELGVVVTEEQAIRALAYDHGVDPRNVIPVEQPGGFHIDMAMLPVADGQIILNDAREAARLEEQWIREDVVAGRLHADDADLRIETLREDAETRAFYEDLAQKDLESGGVRVHRMAGVFHGDDEPMNFLNGEGGTAADGKRFQILLGGERRAEEYVRRKLTKDIPTGIDRLYFLPPVINENLKLQGGLSCRIKGEGRTETCPACKRPRAAQ